MSNHSLEKKLPVKMTKRKLYWTLFIPSIFIFVIALILFPEEKKSFSLFIPLLFWIIYYVVIKVMGLKNIN